MNNNPTYTTKLETIKSNALKDIEAYMADKTHLYVKVNTQRFTLRWIGEILFVKHGILLSDRTTQTICSIADYINSINDK